MSYMWFSKNKSRTAIPDFYLPKTNCIVEVKSTYTYDYQNMIDRQKAYNALGYDFILLLEKKQYRKCPKLR